MAAPSYATDLNNIWLDGGGTAWSTVGGGRTTDPETDDYIQGSSCWSHDPFSSGIEGGVVSAVQTITAGDCVFVWIKCDVAATLAVHASGGMAIIIGDSSTVYDAFYVRGSDDYAYGGWICVPVDPTKTPSAVAGGGATGTTVFGARWNVPASGASKGYPMKVDAMRHGKYHEITAGDSGTPATWDLLAAWDVGTSNASQYGICQPTNTGAAVQGTLYWGTASAAVYSRDSNRSIVLIDTEWTPTDFTQLIFAHASNDIVWDNVGVLALGTNNRGIIDVTADGVVTWTNSVFQGIDTTTLLSNSTFDGCKWLGCNEVDAGGASLLGAKVLLPTVAADSYGLLWNVATDPDGYLDNMEFSKGTLAHHAISFGSSCPAEMTLNDIAFSGFNATLGNNDSALYFPDTGSDVAWIINLVGCTGDISYKKVRAGDTVTLVIDPVTLTITDLVNGSEVRIYRTGTTTEESGVESVTGNEHSYVYTYPTGFNVDIVVHHVDYEYIRRENYALPAVSGDLPLPQRFDPDFNNPD